MLSRSLLLVSCGIASTMILAGCASTDARETAGADTGEAQPIQVQQNFPIAFKKDFVKTISFSKDYGSGDNTFAATAIVTATASINLDTKLSLQAATKWGKLDSFSGDFSGTWNTSGEIDLRVQLTGKAAKNENFVKQFAATTGSHLLSGKETLFNIPIPTGLTLGPAKLNAGIEVALACEADAEVNLQAQATTGVKGNLAYNLGWNRNVDTDSVNAEASHWKVTTTGTNVTFAPPSFSVSEGVATFHAKCALQPAVNLEVDLGSGDVLAANVGAKLVGSAYAVGDGKIDAVAHNWSADYDIGVEGTLDLYAGATVFGHDSTVDKSIPLFGTPAAPLHVGKRHFEGQLPGFPTSGTLPLP